MNCQGPCGRELAEGETAYVQPWTVIAVSEGRIFRQIRERIVCSWCVTGKAPVSYAG